jgi:hypothetical protein
MEFSLELGRQVLRQTPGSLQVLLSDLSGEWLFGDEGPGTWSPWQVVGHLTHIEEDDWIGRTKTILEHGTEGRLRPIDREAGFTRFKDWPLGDLLDRFASLRAANLAVLDTLVGEGELGRKGFHPALGEVTVGQLLATWVVHDLNHFGQILKSMAKQYGAAVGPFASFLPIVTAP